MKLKYYLRGIGIGMLVTAFILVFTGKDTITDDEIRVRAAELGMVSGNEVLTESEMAGGKADKKASVSADKDNREKTTAGNTSSAVSDNKKADAGKNVSQNKASISAGADKDEETLINDEAIASPRSTVTGEDTDRDSESGSNDISVDEEKQKEINDALAESEAKAVKASADESENSAEDSDKVNTAGTDNDSEIIIHVSSGESSYAVAKSMEEAGLVKSAVEFDRFLCAGCYDTALAPGDHTMKKSDSYEMMGEELTKSR
ncbi:MAG: hypothetical protein K6F99_10690 [Lachnospiraceae bacterium]|nr:hypothetical protein [Lachnospiraceae bacterium]